MRRRSVLRACGCTLGLSTAALPSAGAEGASASARQQSQDAYAPLGSVAVEGASEAVVDDAGEFAYVAAGNGFAVIDLADPEKPLVLAETRSIQTDEDQPLQRIQDLAVAGDRLLVPGPAHYDSQLPSGFALFDVSEPASPEQTAFHPTEFHIHNAFLDDETVYLTGSGEGDESLVIVDIAGEPVEIGRWSIVDYDGDWQRVPSPYWTLHDVFVQDELAYLPYWDAGTWLLDVSEPTAPRVVGVAGGVDRAELAGLDTDNFSRAFLQATILPGNHHYAQVDDAGEVLAIGKEAWGLRDEEGVVGEAGELVGDAGGIELWDVSDPAAPTQLARIDPPPSINQTRTGWHTTAHNFELAGDRLYASWYYGGVSIHDVSDPANPQKIAGWHAPRTASFWTAQAGVPGAFFVASSADFSRARDQLNETREALYLFPDRAGTQADPVDLTAWQPDIYGDQPENWNPPPSWLNYQAPPAGDAGSDGFATGFGLGAAIGAVGSLTAYLALEASGTRDADER